MSVSSLRESWNRGRPISVLHLVFTGGSATANLVRGARRGETATPRSESTTPTSSSRPSDKMIEDRLREIVHNNLTLRGQSLRIFAVVAVQRQLAVDRVAANCCLNVFYTHNSTRLKIDDDAFVYFSLELIQRSNEPDDTFSF